MDVYQALDGVFLFFVYILFLLFIASIFMILMPFFVFRIRKEIILINQKLSKVIPLLHGLDYEMSKPETQAGPPVADVANINKENTNLGNEKTCYNCKTNNTTDSQVCSSCGMPI